MVTTGDPLCKAIVTLNSLRIWMRRLMAMCIQPKLCFFLNMVKPIVQQQKSSATEMVL